MSKNDMVLVLIAIILLLGVALIVLIYCFLNTRYVYLIAYSQEGSYYIRHRMRNTLIFNEIMVLDHEITQKDLEEFERKMACKVISAVLIEKRLAEKDVT